jgi:transcriptional regulator with XRE-family HTH domain
MAAFAKSLGISPTSVSLYESGKQIPGQKTIAKICEVYGVDESYFNTPVTKTVSAAGTPTTPAVNKGEKEEKNAGRKTEKTATSKADEVEYDLPTLKAIQDVMERIADNLEETVEEIAEDFEKAVEGKSTPEEIEEAIAEVIEMTTPLEEEKKEKKKSKIAKMDIVIQSPMGGAITPDQIAEKIPEGSEAVYVRVDENKLYWVKGSENGAVDIW